ncbi:MAG TPA: polyprenyl synthetase family protein [Candidatus Saccharimonadia bacterium]
MSATPTLEEAAKAFRLELHAAKQRIDRDIDAYWLAKLSAVRRDFGVVSERAVEAYAGVMRQGGKRIRGALAVQAYRLFGGDDDGVAIGAARLIEMIHAYVLVIDDVCDRSDLRRGGPTAHRRLTAWHHKAKLRGDAGHFGYSLATLTAVAGAHEALLQAGRLHVPAERRLAALENLNSLLITTCHGQFNDIFNEVTGTNDLRQVEDVLLWKTAYYTFANPLQFGALLAGAEAPALNQLLEYSLAAGRAFQISDDILGIYGNEAATGKSPLDDLQEGKRTILVVKALRQGPAEDAAFLEAQLGNPRVGLAELERCRTIIRDSGALAFAQQEVARSVVEAQAALQGGVLPADAPGVQFLRGLASYLTTRQA